MTFSSAMAGANDIYNFDKEVKIFLCSDSSSTATAYCKIRSFVTWYTYSQDMNFFRAGLTGILFHLTLLSKGKMLLAVPLANYIFNEMSGNVARDSTKNLGTASFGKSFFKKKIYSF